MKNRDIGEKLFASYNGSQYSVENFEKNSKENGQFRKRYKFEMAYVALAALESLKELKKEHRRPDLLKTLLSSLHICGKTHYIIYAQVY